MKIKSMTCASCDSHDVVIVLDVGDIDKDFVATSIPGPLGISKGQTLSLSQLKSYIDSEIENNSLEIICECHGNCRDECDVDVVLENDKEYDHNTDYISSSGGYMSTIEKVLYDLTRD